MPRVETSPVWEYFDKKHNFCICKIHVEIAKVAESEISEDEDDPPVVEEPKLCGAIIKGIHAKNCERHIKTNHPSFYETYKKNHPKVSSTSSINASSSGSTSTIKQSTMIQYYETKKLSITIKMAIEDVENACLVMVTVDGRPFSAVEDEGVQLMLKPILHALNLTKVYSMNRKKIRELVILKANEMRQEIKTRLSNRLISLKVDCATRLGRSFLCINTQLMINGKFILLTLAVVELKERHTGENLKQIILMQLEKFGVSLRNIYSVTSDNGANILKSVKLMNENISSIQNQNNVGEAEASFIASTSNTSTSTISKTYEENDDDYEIMEVSVEEMNETMVDSSETGYIVNENIAMEPGNTIYDELLVETNLAIWTQWTDIKIHSIRSAAHTMQLAIVKTLEESTKLPVIDNARRVVKILRTRTPNIMLLLEKSTQLKAILDNNTRWLSVFDMLKRLLLLKDYVVQLALVSDNLVLSEAEWSEIQNIVGSLKAAKKATIALQKANLSFDELYEIWIKCELDVKKIAHPLAQQLHQELKMEKEKKNIFGNSAFKATLYLNPKFNKVMKLVDKNEAIEELTNVYVRLKTMNTSDTKNSTAEVETKDTTNDDDVLMYLRSESQLLDHETEPDQPHIEKLKRTFQAELRNFYDFKEGYDPSEEIITYWIKNTAYKKLRFILDELRSKLTGDILDDLLMLRGNYNIFEKFVAFIHIGEAAVTVRNALLKYSEDPDLIKQFRIFTNMSAEDFYTFKREISELIKARNIRNILAHLGNNEIENFDAEKLKEDFEKLELTTNSVFNKV